MTLEDAEYVPADILANILEIPDSTLIGGGSKFIEQYCEDRASLYVSLGPSLHTGDANARQFRLFGKRSTREKRSAPRYILGVSGTNYERHMVNADVGTQQSPVLVRLFERIENEQRMVLEAAPSAMWLKCIDGTE